MYNDLRTISERLNDSKTSPVEIVQRKAFIELVISLPLPKGSKALSVSTGDGSWDFLVLDKEPRISSVCATDVVPNPVDAQDQKILNKRGAWKFIQVEKEKALPFKNEEFELIYHHDVLEHIQKPYLFIREQYRVLKTGGWLVFSTPNLYRPANVAKILLGKLSFPTKIGYVNTIGDYIHIKEYNSNDLKILLNEVGFRDVKIGSLYFGVPRLKLDVVYHPSTRITEFFCHYLLVSAKK